MSLSCKLLGVTVTHDWNFDDHITSVCGRMFERLPHIRAIRYNVPKKVLINVSRALVMTIAEFACDITLTKPSNMRRVQRVQNILLRVITFSDIMKSIEVMLRETQLLNTALTVKYYQIWAVERLLMYKNAKFAYKQINWEFSVPHYDTRHHHLHLHYKPRTAAGRDSALWKAVREFNAFKLFFTNWSSEETAKQDLKEMLLSRYKNGNLK